MKTKPKENNLPEADDKSCQSLINLKPTYEISSEQNSQLNLEISPHFTLPQESISASFDSLPLSADALRLNTQEHFISSSRPLAPQQIKAVSKCLISESSQPNSSSHNVLAVADLHLSTIDWEGTSFSNSPVIPRNSCPRGLKSELPTAIPDSFETIPGQLSCDKVLDRDLRRTDPEEHLLSGITDLCLQDLPLKKRILTKSSHPQDNVQPDTDLKTLSLLTVKESCIATSSSVYPSHLSKDLLRVYLPNESRNSEVLKGDQLFQENYKVNTSVPHSVKNMVVKTSNVRAEPSNTSFDHSRKVDLKTTQKIVMRNSVCLDRYSSDEESIPRFEKAKYATEKMKQSSRKHKPAQFKKNDANKLIQVKETEQYAQAYKTAGTEEKYFPEAAKGSLSFLQCRKEKDDPDTCLDSPLPLCQRLKLRFQNT